MVLDRTTAEFDESGDIFEQEALLYFSFYIPSIQVGDLSFSATCVT